MYKSFLQVGKAPRKRVLFAALPVLPILLHPPAEPGSVKLREDVSAGEGGTEAGRHACHIFSISKA